MNLETIKEWGKRYGVWGLIVGIVILVSIYAFDLETAEVEKITGIANQIDSLYTDAYGGGGPAGLPALQMQMAQEQAEGEVMKETVINPLKSYGRGILMILLSTAMTGIVLFVMTQLKFLNGSEAGLFRLIGMIFMGNIIAFSAVFINL